MKKGAFVLGLFVSLGIGAFAFNSPMVFAEDVIEVESNRMVVTTDIDSSVEEVWREMIDFRGYGQWNQWYGVEGEARLGSVVEAHAEGQHLQLKITKIEENTLCWVDVSWFTHFGMGGWRCRSVRANPDGSGVKFTNHFEFTGPLRFVLQAGAKKILLKGMILENKNLKDFLERR